MTVQARRDVFQAIADPTRREIIQLIAKGPMNLNSIADNFDISRPAISQHIKILNECGLIEIENVGRERFCKIQPRQLVPAFMWLEQYKILWTEKLDAFEKYVNQLQTKKSKHGTKKRTRK